jgi:hypothetical protein
MGDTKLCSKCRIEQPATAFRKNGCVCRSCRNRQQQAYRTADPERTRNYDRRRDPEKRRESYRKWAELNPERVVELHKKSTAKHRQNINLKMREYNKQNRFRIALREAKKAAARRDHSPCTATVEQVQSAFTGFCHNPACNRPEGSPKLHLDHCHKTGAFRGWLCNRCNQAAGMLDDSPEKMRGLAMFLESAVRSAVA